MDQAMGYHAELEDYHFVEDDCMNLVTLGLFRRLFNGLLRCLLLLTMLLELGRYLFLFESVPISALQAH